VLVIAKWQDHQKVDKPSQRRVLGESSRKLAIPLAVRREVASKYGCEPGEEKDAKCYFCGEVGSMKWWRLYSGKPSGWVSFNNLELDHFIPEASGGANSAPNIVLSCRSCNRSRRDQHPIDWVNSRILASPREPSPLEGKGRERNGSGKEGKPRTPTARADGMTAPHFPNELRVQLRDAWRAKVGAVDMARFVKDLAPIFDRPEAEWGFTRAEVVSAIGFGYEWCMAADRRSRRPFEVPNYTPARFAGNFTRYLGYVREGMATPDGMPTSFARWRISAGFFGRGISPTGRWQRYLPATPGPGSRSPSSAPDTAA
jgi:hypothetical protein